LDSADLLAVACDDGSSLTDEERIIGNVRHHLNCRSIYRRGFEE
jgi:hypothetical protein